MKKKKILRWIEMTAFALLLVGGLNFLLMGLFNFDLFGAIFGGSGSVTSRVFYSLFGISAAILFAVILWKAFMTRKPVTVTSNHAATTTAK